MTQQTLNVMRREAERATNRLALPKMGIVTSYDAGHYACKVRLQPEDAETGWMPVASIWTGNGWGVFCPPSPGDVVDVHFQEGGKEAGYVSQRFFSAVTRPLPVPSGEMWIQHKSGSSLKFKNDGTVEIHAAQINSSAPLWHHDGNLRVTGDIYDLDAAHGTFGALRAAYDGHRHSGVINGSGSTGPTDSPV